MVIHPARIQGRSRKLLSLATGLIALPITIAAFGTCESNAQPATAAQSPAQTANKLEFEVVSIRPSPSPNDHQNISFSGSTFTATITVKSLIERAYGIRDFQVLGAPKWLDSAKYEIAAKSNETEAVNKLTPNQQDAAADRQMRRVQSLLADRFQLKFHREKKQLPAYALVVVKGGPKLQPPKPGESHRLYTQGPGRLACYSASMSELAEELPDDGVNRIVLDKLSGRYDFSLRWTPDDDSSSRSDSSAPSIFTAMQEQLGLKLEPTKAPTDVLVIDHVERPSEN